MGSGESVRESMGAQRREKGKGREERKPGLVARATRGATPEKHARTRCVISDCLAGFVGGRVGCIQDVQA